MTVLKYQFQAVVFFSKNENTKGVLKSPFLRIRRCTGGIAVSVIFFHPSNLSKKAHPPSRISPAVGAKFGST